MPAAQAAPPLPPVSRELLADKALPYWSVIPAQTEAGKGMPPSQLSNPFKNGFKMPPHCPLWALPSPLSRMTDEEEQASTEESDDEYRPAAAAQGRQVHG